mmetsp:Transcript_67508/g.135597  ORF Transcript_67508/g.135597 Transcript_67508/m.135597 type:complete len:260 (-) Transcript_67508:270-1049(-)
MQPTARPLSVCRVAPRAPKERRAPARTGSREWVHGPSLHTTPLPDSRRDSRPPHMLNWLGMASLIMRTSSGQSERLRFLCFSAAFCSMAVMSVSTASRTQPDLKADTAENACQRAWKGNCATAPEQRPGMKLCTVQRRPESMKATASFTSRKAVPLGSAYSPKISKLMTPKTAPKEPKSTAQTAQVTGAGVPASMSAQGTQTAKAVAPAEMAKRRRAPCSPRWLACSCRAWMAECNSKPPVTAIGTMSMRKPVLPEVEW